MWSGGGFLIITIVPVLMCCIWYTVDLYSGRIYQASQETSLSNHPHSWIWKHLTRFWLWIWPHWFRLFWKSLHPRSATFLVYTQVFSHLMVIFTNKFFKPRQESSREQNHSERPILGIWLGSCHLGCVLPWTSLSPQSYKLYRYRYRYCPFVDIANLTNGKGLLDCLKIEE